MGNTWKDTDLEDLSKLVSARLPSTVLAEPATTSESGSLKSTGDTGGSGSTSGGEENRSSSAGVSSSQGKRRASPTELPKEDRRGDMRMSKRPSIKRALRSSDDSSCDDGARRVGYVPQALRPAR